ncbi:MAG: ribosome small subunit-dependent GTPase A [Spirochaetae bacterium HGW-Spirochaetae-9]|nr:MAG: ribosome small subunit-dependent GTPase A [Spirochaetae bacterium HGW-Spirochaetae-9]
MTGIVLFSTNNTARVLCDDGAVRLCTIKGKRIKTLHGQYNGLAVGDTVDIIPTDMDQGLVSKLHERKNTFGRYNEKGRSEQAIAANIDRVFCITSPLLPPFRPRFIDRLAVMAGWARVPFVIVLNKIDLCLPEDVRERLENYRDIGYTVIHASAKTGEGIAQLQGLLAGSLSVFGGQSGVGKSSLLNALIPGIGRRTGEVSEKYNRGKHTTTMAEMIIADGDMRIVDTPGIRRLALRSLPAEDLASCFPEMLPLIVDCAFGSRCTHTDEEGCAVVEGVEESSIHPDRYESYLRIREELVQPVAWKKSGVRDPGRKERGFSGRIRSKIRGSGSADLDEHDELF